MSLCIYVSEKYKFHFFTNIGQCDTESYKIFRLTTGCSGKNSFFPRNLIILPSLPRKHWAAIGYTETGRPIRVTLRSHCLRRYVGEGWVAVDNEKSQFFLRERERE